MKFTEKLGLKKPELTDYVNVNDLNDNMDVLDEEVGNLKEGSTTIEELQTSNKTLAGAINELSNKKVDKVTGKGLSTNDYTDEEKQKNQDNADNISDLQQELETHKAESVSQRPHGISDIASKTYNRGAWTPVIREVSGVTVTHTIQTGNFQRIDDLFYVNGYIKATVHQSGASHALQIEGLPITPLPGSITTISGFVSKFNSEGYTQVVAKHDGTRYLLYIEFYLIGSDKTPRILRLSDIPNGEEIEIYLEGSFRV